MNALVVGWFSFEEMGATAGDVLVRDVVCGWLDEAGCTYDVALAPPFDGGVDWRTVDPDRYTAVVFACGPFGNGWPLTELLDRFAGKRLFGLNVTMLEPVEVWNPFDVLLERDSSRAARPDLSFAASAPAVPVVGLVLIDEQPEYGEGDDHARANDALRSLLARREAATVEIDTRLDVNRTGLRTPAEVESLVARMDVVLTTRLHGMALALKNGVPPVVVDSVAGGAKVTRQAHALRWPLIHSVDALDPEALERAFEYALTEDARREAQRCANEALAAAGEVRAALLAALRAPP